MLNSKLIQTKHQAVNVNVNFLSLVLCSVFVFIRSLKRCGVVSQISAVHVITTTIHNR